MPEETAVEKVIDVVEDFSCPYQSAAYQEAFRSWRRKKQNPYAFRFTKNPKEASFAESQSAVGLSPAKTEQSILNRLGKLIGCALIGYLVAENILDKAAVMLMHLLHLHIELVFFGESRLYGDERLVFWLTFGIQFVKYLIPALLLQFTLRMPVQVSLPMKIYKPARLVLGIGMVMLLSIGMGILQTPLSADMEKYRIIAGTDHSENGRMIFHLLLTILLLPMITELFLHGCMFQALRQFGDDFAVISTSVLAAALTHNLPDAIRIGLVHLLISYYLIYTGSFWSASVLRIVHEIYMFALFYMESSNNAPSLQWWTMVLIPCIICTVAGIYLFLKRNRSQDKPALNTTYLNLREKLEAFFTAMPMVAFLICSVLLLVITSMLS
ncbi:MAG: CPBP family intramembrane metalloprotease [Oscillospiraceae bacterium]|nr:CPBP family intramembrane metalloprotease [Oscillospiraceae bacterium]